VKTIFGNEKNGCDKVRKNEKSTVFFAKKWENRYVKNSKN
jgi:hypothetical protein